MTKMLEHGFHLPIIYDNTESSRYIKCDTHHNYYKITFSKENDATMQ